MKLLLSEDIPNLGYCGDEVEVKDGYGRNYLVPKGKALVATPENVKAFRHQKWVVQAKMRKLKLVAEDVAGKITAVKCKFVKKVGEQGKLFGSVTSQDIAQFLNDKGLKIDRRKLVISEPIKSLGEHTVEYKLHKEVTAKIVVQVISETKEETPSSEEVAATTKAVAGEETKKEDG